MTTTTPTPTPDDSAFVGVPASALPDGTITQPEEDGYLAAEGPHAVVARAAKVAEKAQRDADDVRRQLITLYIVLWVALIMFGGAITQSIENSFSNCKASNMAAAKYNKALTALVDTPGLKPETKLIREKQFADLYAATYHCTGIWPFQ